jgi:TonB-dependent SusC/RagA subfamily outer membrane receptor
MKTKLFIALLFLFGCNTQRIDKNSFNNKDGFSIQKLDKEDLNFSREENFNKTLAGKVSGLQILDSSSSTFELNEIMIRGERNILYLVDGIKMQPNEINTSIIQSVKVIKGPSAASLYGNEAVNGVILISTRR